MSTTPVKAWESIKDIPVTPLTDKASIYFLIGESIMLSFIERPPGAEFSIHKHDAEQVLIILEGSEEHIADGQTIHMKMEAGDVLLHPPNVEHGGRTPTGLRGIDIFVSPREDYIELIKKYHKKEGKKNTNENKKCI